VIVEQVGFTFIIEFEFGSVGALEFVGQEEGVIVTGCGGC
jgi:hypothetical protein